MRSGVICFGTILILDTVEISKFYIYKFIFFVAPSNRIFTDFKVEGKKVSPTDGFTIYESFELVQEIGTNDLDRESP